VRSELVFGYEAGSLSKDGSQCSGIELLMLGDRQSLRRSTPCQAAKFHVAPALCLHGKTKSGQDSDHLVA
jgi:hypothetical protein